MKAAQRAEWILRHTVTYPALRRLFRNTPRTDQVDLSAVRSVLVLRYDRFGDMIVTSPITRHLKNVNPDMTVGIAASRGNAELARHLPGVDTVHVVAGRPAEVLGSVLTARRHSYDVVLNFILNRTTTGGILANTMAPKAVKVGQGADKYAFYFNRMVSLTRGSRHMVNHLDHMCADVFGDSWGRPDLRYGLLEEPSSEMRVEDALRTFRPKGSFRTGRYAILNITAGEERRNPTIHQMMLLARYLTDRVGLPLVMVGAPDSYETLRHIREQIGSKRLAIYPERGRAPFIDMVPLIRRASFLVSPDTSLVHVACATRTPAVAFYASSREFAEWSPVGIPYEAVFDPESGVVRTIRPEEMMAAVDRLLTRGWRAG